VKTKLRDRVQVVQDVNDKVTVEDDVFQLDELVDLYRVAPSIDRLRRKIKFPCRWEYFVDVDADVEKLNDILKTNGYTKVDKDDEIDKLQFNEEDYDGHDYYKIEEEEEEDNSN
jgi:hypothetical protein